jgi:hypothetical protein
VLIARCEVVELGIAAWGLGLEVLGVEYWALIEGCGVEELGVNWQLGVDWALWS